MIIGGNACGRTFALAIVHEPVEPSTPPKFSSFISPTTSATVPETVGRNVRSPQTVRAAVVAADAVMAPQLIVTLGALAPTLRFTLLAVSTVPDVVTRLPLSITTAD